MKSSIPSFASVAMFYGQAIGQESFRALRSRSARLDRSEMTMSERPQGRQPTMGDGVNTPNSTNGKRVSCRVVKEMLSGSYLDLTSFRKPCLNAVRLTTSNQIAAVIARSGLVQRTAL